MKNILILGGSYFVGRVFTIMAASAGHALTLINRGRFSMERYGTKEELHFDRHDVQALRSMSAQHYDAVVDFCGYEPGDVCTVVENLPGTIGQYIFLSTGDVYDRTIHTPKGESTPLLKKQSSCAGGEYMYKKALLDQETREICAKKGIAYTVLRPAFIYGPYNYAPRESYYVKKILDREPIPVPRDADSEFQFVYVRDVAVAILECMEREAARNEVFNLSAPEIMNYERFMQTLKAVSDRPYDTYPISVQSVISQGITLPFPMRKEESELFCGDKAAQALGLSYTPFMQGLTRAYQGFCTVFGG